MTQAVPRTVLGSLELDRRLPLNETYNAYCGLCKIALIHKHNQIGICPDCAADVRAGRKAWHLPVVE